jgi:hypothetical protein
MNFIFFCLDNNLLYTILYRTNEELIQTTDVPYLDNVHYV